MIYFSAGVTYPVAFINGENDTRTAQAERSISNGLPLFVTPQLPKAEIQNLPRKKCPADDVNMATLVTCDVMTPVTARRCDDDVEIKIERFRVRPCQRVDAAKLILLKS